MGLDVYAGPLTRYYAGDWETIVQQASRAAGFEVAFVDSQGRPISRTPDNVDEVIAGVEAWIEELTAGVESHAGVSIAWTDDPAGAYQTDKPDWDGYTALILWSAYATAGDLPLPEQLPEDITNDPAYSRATTAENPPAIVMHASCEWWLPATFDAVIPIITPDARQVFACSLPRLKTALRQLNDQTWRASAQTIAEWREAGPVSKTEMVFDEHGEPVLEDVPPAEDGAGSEFQRTAQFGFAVMTYLVEWADENQMPMLLDY